MAQGCARQLCHSFAAQVGTSDSFVSVFVQKRQSETIEAVPTKGIAWESFWESLGNPAAATPRVSSSMKQEYGVPIGYRSGGRTTGIPLPVHGCRCSAVEKKFIPKGFGITSTNKVLGSIQRNISGVCCEALDFFSMLCGLSLLAATGCQNANQATEQDSVQVKLKACQARDPETGACQDPNGSKIFNPRKTGLLVRDWISRLVGL